MPADREVNDWQDMSLALLEHPNDFSLWQLFIYGAEFPDGRLLDITSTKIQKDLLRQSYESILRKYPLLSKYWIAYAQWERKFENNEKADLIFRRGTCYVSLDVHFWVAYLNFKIQCISNNIEEVSELFEIARGYIGFHYYAFEFYSLYISFLQSYATAENKFEDKMALLLRLTMEVPLYDLAGLFKEVFAFIQPRDQSFKHLTSFLGEKAVKSLRKDCNNNSNIILQKLTKFVSDAYVVSQYKTYELYKFERLIPSPISFCPEMIPTLALESLHQYLDFSEQNFSFQFVTQLYERCAYLTSLYAETIEKYVDFLLTRKKYNAARQVLQKGVLTVLHQGSTTLFLRLVDLELYLGNIVRARDLITSYMMYNNSSSVQIYYKLLEIEALVSQNDQEHICRLVKIMIETTKSKDFFKKIQCFALSRKRLAELYLLFTSNAWIKDLGLRSCEYFWAALREYADEKQLDEISIPEFTL